MPPLLLCSTWHSMGCRSSSIAESKSRAPVLDLTDFSAIFVTRVSLTCKSKPLALKKIAYLESSCFAIFSSTSCVKSLSFKITGILPTISGMKPYLIMSSGVTSFSYTFFSLFSKPIFLTFKRSATIFSRPTKAPISTTVRLLVLNFTELSQIHTSLGSRIFNSSC